MSKENNNTNQDNPRNDKDESISYLGGEEKTITVVVDGKNAYTHT